MLDRQRDPGFAAEYGILQFQNVSLSINGVRLIHHMNCTLDSTHRTVVMGPNGAGKSLFLRLLAGLLQPTSGTIKTPPLNQKDRERVFLSLVFQNPVLLRRSTRDNIAYVLHQQNYPKTKLSRKVQNALMEARLEAKADIPARRLSGGERQRLALARALVVNPKYLLLDEVTASLDPASTHIVERMVVEASHNDTKILFITHDVRQAKRIADDILFIHMGRIMTHKPVAEFFRDPGSNEAQAYLDGRLPIS